MRKNTLNEIIEEHNVRAIEFAQDVSEGEFLAFCRWLEDQGWHSNRGGRSGQIRMFEFVKNKGGKFDDNKRRGIFIRLYTNVGNHEQSFSIHSWTYKNDTVWAPEKMRVTVEGPAPITGKDILQDLGEFFIRVPLKHPIYIEEAAEWLEAHGFKHTGGLPPDQLFGLDHIRGHTFGLLQCTAKTNSFSVNIHHANGLGLGELPEAKYYVRNRVETRNKERAKQIQHGQQLAEQLRILADSVEASGVVDAHLNFTNKGLTPLVGYDGNVTWLDSGSRHLELNYTVPKN